VIRKTMVGGGILLVAILFFSQTGATSETSGGIVFAGAAGTDEVVGYTGTVYMKDVEEVTWTETEFTFTGEESYGGDAKAIKVEPDLDLTLKLQASFERENGCSIHLGGWRTSGSASISGSVSGWKEEEEYEEHEGGGSYSYSLSVPYVTMWGEIFYSYSYSEIYGYYDYMEDSYGGGYDPEAVSTKYDASRDVSLNTYYLTLKTANPGIHLVGGVRYARVSFDDVQHVNGEFEERYIDLYDYTGDPENPENWDWWEEDYYYNNYDLKLTSSVDTSGIGPLVGVAGRCKLTKKINVGIEASRSYILGAVSREALFVDIDDVERSYYENYYGEEYTEEGTDYMKGEISFERNCTAIIPVTEGQIDLRYQLTDNLILSIGYFYSLWQDVPMPAQFQYLRVGGEEIPNVENFWVPDPKKDILVSGPKLEIAWRF